MNHSYLDTGSGSRKMTAALMCTSAFQMSQLIISTGLSDIAAVFPQHSATAVQMILTFPDLAILLATLFVGRITSRISPRKLIFAGLCCVAVTGVGGYFFHSTLGLLYLWSTILGFGRGLFASCVVICMQTCYDERERGRVIGMQSAYVNFSGVALTVLSGVLNAYAWHTGYLVFLLAIPAAAMALVCLPKGTCQSPEAHHREGTRRVYPAVVLYALLAFLFLIVYNVYIVNSSMLFQQLGLENTGLLAGISNGLFLLGGCVSALLFERLTKKLGDGLIMLSFLAVGAGLAICYMFRSVGMLFLAGFLSGSGISFITPQINLSISRKVPAQALSLNSSLYLGALYVGGFVSAPIITPLAAGLGDGVIPRFVLGALLSVLFAAFSFLSLRREKS